jgi:hypothetical protein
MAAAPAADDDSAVRAAGDGRETLERCRLALVIAIRTDLRRGDPNGECTGEERRFGRRWGWRRNDKSSVKG